MDTTPLLHYVRHYDGILSPDTIKELFNWYAQGGVTPRNTPLYKFEEKELQRNNSRERALQEQMMKATNDAVNRYIQDCGITEAQWPNDYKLEGFRMKTYRGGEGCFNEHVDVTDRASCSRFLVIMFYLSSRGEGKGGGTTFIDGLEIEPVAGRVAIFPPLWPWLHAGGKPEGWTKHTIQTYLHYA